MAPADVVGLAQALGVPVFTVRRLRSAASVAALASLRPEVLCAACFPRRLPPAWLAAPARGAFNVHPSLLPAYRGPEPLFWQFRLGEAHTGVTVHQMDLGFDTGPILAQAEVAFADGLSGSEAERLTARAGARLLVAALQTGPLPVNPQPEAGASYFPRPGPADLVVGTDWPARRAFNFMRGAEAWGPFDVVGPQGRWRAAAAEAWREAGSAAGGPAAPAGQAWVDFTPGAVRLRLAGVTPAALP
jgi:methionyl-tRNA formyltransferase